MTWWLGRTCRSGNRQQCSVPNGRTAWLPSFSRELALARTRMCHSSESELRCTRVAHQFAGKIEANPFLHRYAGVHAEAREREGALYRAYLHRCDRVDPVAHWSRQRRLIAAWGTGPIRICVTWCGE